MLSRAVLASRPAVTRTPIVLARRSAGGGSYNPPTGWIFGEKPPPPGQRRQKEGWERIFYWGMGTSIVGLFAAAFYKPDTNVVDWAKEEARKRMEARGDLPVYTPPTYNTISYEEWERRQESAKHEQTHH